MQRRVLYIANNCPKEDKWKHVILYPMRLLEAKTYVTKYRDWPMRNAESGKFYWPLTPGPKMHWSVHSSETGYASTTASKRASEAAPPLSSPFKRQLQAEEEPSEKLASKRNIKLPPIKSFFQRTPNTFPIPTHISNLSASNQRDPIASDSGTCTTERYAIGHIFGGGKLVRRIVSLHSWQNFVAPTTAECFAVIERTFDPNFQDKNHVKRIFTVDESAVGFLKPDWQ